MSAKRNGKRAKQKRRGKRTNPIRVALAALCAVAVCAAVVCIVTLGVGRFMTDKETGKSAGMEAQKAKEGKMQEENAPEILVKEPDHNSTEAGPDAQTEPDRKTETLPEKEQEAEGEQAAEKTQQTRTTVSILGDSISTFRDYIPAGYYDFFPENGLVSDVNDTWWKRVLDDTGWTLYVNGSSSGATCTGDSTGTADPQCGCNELRTGALYGPDGAVPDVIIVYMGTNDLLQSIPMGNNDGTLQVAEGVVSTFSDAYTLMLDKLRMKYPASKIYCCTITQIGDYGTKTPYVEFVNGEGLTAADYSAQIAQIAANKSLPVIDLYSCGIAVDNLHNTSADGVHPTPDGMKYIAEAVRKVLD